jgi:hypothetical protein
MPVLLHRIILHLQVFDLVWLVKVLYFHSLNFTNPSGDYTSDSSFRFASLYRINFLL